MKLHRIVILLGIVMVVGLSLALVGARLTNAKSHSTPSAVPTLSLLYQFSGVTDDGEQGSASRREATSIHCTNTSAEVTQVEVRLYQWNGTDVFTGTVNMPPNRTFTFSTQNTTIYFDDVILGGSPGTPAIFQGSGQVLANRPEVICSVQALDPLNYPPTFITRIPLYDRNGNLLKREPPQPDLWVTQTASPVNAMPHDTITYLIAYGNNGNALANQVVITDVIPTELTNLAWTATPPLTPNTGTTYVWPVGDLLPGQTGWITITGQPIPSIADGTLITNAITIAGANPNQDFLNQHIEVSILVYYPKIYLPKTFR
ncbi:MAG: DUF11 domain-containing protein [Anaerolineales bacterium]|nr:DUF11 domain-containing protein [Anaerolineales bacterium]